MNTTKHKTKNKKTKDIVCNWTVSAYGKMYAVVYGTYEQAQAFGTLLVVELNESIGLTMSKKELASVLSNYLEIKTINRYDLTK